MASQLTIPSISAVTPLFSHNLYHPGLTETIFKDDLLAFHAQAYGRHFRGSIPDLSAGYIPSHVLDEAGGQSDDTLGYYQDGVKRTLTDAQIAMFRHSEVQAVLREQRHAREKESSDFLTVARSQDLQDGVWGLQEVDEDQEIEGDGTKERDVKDIDIEDLDIEGDVDIEEDDEEEYARFLEAERREMKLAASSRVAKNGKNQKSQAGKASTRRNVRELDEIRSCTDALDYGD
ncbi:hypothetical protein MMC18_007973 [Xylographa bjoerkii]|nr:hypothetical protein [Xylographa bjoerkii]